MSTFPSYDDEAPWDRERSALLHGFVIGMLYKLRNTPPDAFMRIPVEDFEHLARGVERDYDWMMENTTPEPRTGSTAMSEKKGPMSLL